MKNTVHLGPAGLAKSKQAGARNGMSGATIPGLPNHPASRKPSPGLEPEPSGPHPSRCPPPRREGEGLGGVTYLLGHQAGDAHGPPHPAFLGPGLQSPCPARLPRWGRHGGLGSPQLACPGPKGPASASPAPQRQPQPRLRPSRWRPGSQGSLWHEARVTGAGVTLAVSAESSPPGSGRPWPPGAGPAARVLRSARCRPSSSRAPR